ncbi:MAG: heparan-alpha-glucosaminide N-acetyltransferase domain-containing protein [Herbiconiux sp.]|nr:heparan-alpha-glucosaminide N-acetyltransferase domain-containing protein [Herbiconiux sp.]
MRGFSTTRLAGIDIARGFAVLTMFVAHVAPQAGGGVAGIVLDVAGGERPRTVFAVAGGIALGLFVQSALRRGVPIGELRRSIAVRGVFLIALGLLLQTMSSGVSVVLDTWGVLFLVALPFLRVPNRWLLVAAAVLLVAGTAITVAFEQPLIVYTTLHTEWLQVGDWAVTGSYPLLTWLGLLAIGYAVSRLALTERRTQLLLIAVGVVLMLGIAARLVFDEKTFGFELSVHVAAAGFAVALVAALLFVTTGDSPVPRVITVILTPLRAVGAMPLTIYTAHVVALTFWRSDGAPGYATWWPFILLTLASLVVATLWRLFLGQGPLERLTALLSRPRPAPRAAHARP